MVGQEQMTNVVGKERRGHSWCVSGKESTCQWRGHGFDPPSGKIPHALEQVSPCTTAFEPHRIEPASCNS